MPAHLALFDLDYTLLPIDSDYEWGRFTSRMGWTDGAAFEAANERFYADYCAGTLDIHAYVRFATAAIRAHSAIENRAAHARFMREVVQKALHPQALALLRAHQRAGHSVVIVTATNAFVTRPIAQALGVDALIAIELATDATGRYSGEIAGTPSFREGKVARVHAWLAQRQCRLSDLKSTFYTDSMNDLPLLEQVTTPVATNPDARLRALAHERGWRVLDLFK